MTPSVIRSGVGCVDGNTGEFSPDGRDLKGGPQHASPPLERWEGWRVAVRDQVRGWMRREALMFGKAWNSPNKVGTPMKSTGSEGGTRVNGMFGKEMFGKGSRKCLKRVGVDPFQHESWVA